MKKTSLLFLLGIFGSILAQAQYDGPDRPKLVVSIIVDQMRVDYLYRYWDQYGDDGFKRMIDEGHFCRNTHYNYMSTLTGPGHTSVHTGTTPENHGIIANSWFLRESGRYTYCALDTTVNGVGYDGSKGQRSPAWLRSTTLADELELATNRRAKTIGLANKDRGGILSAGRLADAAFWFVAGNEGKYISSTWYMKELPDWLNKFNSKKLPQKYIEEPWETLLPIEEYGQSIADDNPYETVFASKDKPTFPYDLKAISEAMGTMDIIRYTPMGNSLTVDMAIATIDGEGLGQDEDCDMLNLSFSPTDKVGHYFGVTAVETQDTYLRLDRDLARLFTHLDKTVGEGQYLVFLTADHGGPHNPGYMKDEKAHAGFIQFVGVETIAQEALEKAHGPGDWVLDVGNEQVFLNREYIAQRGLDLGRQQQIVADALIEMDGVMKAVTANTLNTNDFNDGVLELVQNGYDQERSGDVMFVTDPGFYPWESWYKDKGSDHRAPWAYDTHVPLIFFGHGVEPGETIREVSITDIAPTVAMMLSIQEPNSTTGKVITEVIKAD